MPLLFVRWKKLLRKRFFLSIILSYVALLIIPAVLGGVLYTITFSNAERQLKENNQSLLRQTGEILDSIYLEVQRVASHVAIHKEINRFAEVTDILETSAMSQAFDYISTHVLYPFSLSSSYISEYYVFFNESQIALGPNTVAPSPLLYDVEIQIVGMSYEQWRGSRLQTFHGGDYYPADKMENNSQGREVIPFYQTLGSRDNIKGTLVIFLDAKKINRLLEKIDVSEGGAVGLFSRKGDYLTGISNNFELSRTILNITVNPEKYYRSEVKSEISGWTYLAIQDKTTVLKELGYIRRTTLVVIFILLAMGLVTALILGFRSAAPFDDILGLLIKETDGAKKVFIEEIIEGVKKVIRREGELEARLAEVGPRLKAQLVENLISGSFNSTKALKTFLSDTGVSLPGQYNTVVVFNFDHSDDDLSPELMIELDTEKGVLKESLERMFPGAHLLAEQDFSRVLMIHSGNGITKSAYASRLQGDLKALIHQLNENFYIHLTAALGKAYTDLRHINRSHADAISLLEAIADDDRHTLLSLSQTEKSGLSSFFLPLEIEQKLMNTLLTGNVDSAQSIFDELIDENFRKRDLSAAMAQAFLESIRNMIVRTISRDWTVKSRRNELHEKVLQIPLDVAQAEDSLKTLWLIAEKMAQDKQHNKKNRTSVRKEAIASFIAEHFMDFDMSIARLSEEFRVSEIYFSRFFKEQFGINFHHYLEDLRLNLAAETLKSTDKAIKEVLGDVGYSNMNTFSRAFKRKFGISPSSFRASFGKPF